MHQNCGPFLSTVKIHTAVAAIIQRQEMEMERTEFSAREMWIPNIARTIDMGEISRICATG